MDDIPKLFFIVIMFIVVSPFPVVYREYAWPIIVVGGMAVIVYWSYRLFRIIKSKQWECVIGIVELTSICEYQVYTQSKTFLTYYYPNITVRYKILGKSKSSNKTTLDVKSLWSVSRIQIENMVNKMQPGSSINVYIDPKNSDLGIVFPGLSNYRIFRHLFFILAGMCILAVGFIVGYMQNN